jgi:pimeloyl-ACP methyl ester carboxylesterase
MIAGMASRSTAMLVMCGALILTTAAPTSPQNRSTANAPLQLQTRVLGSGNPVILLGGGLLGADGWGGVPALLAKTHRVINAQSLAVQYGLDGKTLPVRYELQTEVDALRASLDSTHVDVADIIGMSHGGVTGLLFALQNPRRVRTLTLIEPPAFWVLPNHGYDDAGAREMQEFISALRDQTITEAHVERFRCLLDDCTGGRSPRQAPQWNQWVRYRNSLRGLHTIGDHKDDPSRLRALLIPTLVVNGAGTVAFHRAINAALIRTLPRAQAFGLTGGHNSPASAPDDFVAEWMKFQERAFAGRGQNR